MKGKERKRPKSVNGPFPACSRWKATVSKGDWNNVSLWLWSTKTFWNQPNLTLRQSILKYKGMWSNYPAKKVGCEHNHLRLLHPLKKILSCLTMNNSFLFRTRQVLLTSRRSLPCTLFCLLICLKFITTLGKTFRSPPTNYSISGART